MKRYRVTFDYPHFQLETYVWAFSPDEAVAKATEQNRRHGESTNPVKVQLAETARGR